MVANNAKGHVRANAWLNIGWKIGRIALGHSIVFIREAKPFKKN